MEVRRPGCAGVSLVEALVAMAVFAVGIAALAPLIVSTVRGNEAAAVRSRAVALAQEKIEDIKTLPYDEVLALAAGSEPVDTVYTRSWESLDPAPPLTGDGDDLRRIGVTVSWSLPAQGGGSVTLIASKARY